MLHLNLWKDVLISLIWAQPHNKYSSRINGIAIDKINTCLVNLIYAIQIIYNCQVLHYHQLYISKHMFYQGLLGCIYQNFENKPLLPFYVKIHKDS